MTERQKINNFIRKLKWAYIQTPEDCRHEGIKLCKYPIGVGAFREVYKVWGLPIVIKFPLNPSDRTHSIAEWIAYNKIKYHDKFKNLRKYIPTVYHFRMDSGIIAMRYYKPLDPEKLDEKYRLVGKDDIIRKRLSKRIKKRYRTANDIVNDGNVARDKNGQLKIIDLGCFDEVW